MKAWHPHTEHLAHMLLETVEQVPERTALVLPATDTTPERRWSYAELLADARRVAAQLVLAGVGKDSRVAIFSNNRPQWSIVDFACLLVGAVTVPIYPTSTPDQAAYILENAQVVGAFVEGATGLERLAQVWERLPGLREIVTFDPVDLATGPALGERAAHVRTLADLLAIEHDDAEQAQAHAEIDRRLAAASGEDIATIIYTSGTTGTPKGVVLPHRAFLHELNGLAELFAVGPQDTSLCFLPLSHALERGWSFFVYYLGAANIFVTNPKEVAALLRSQRPSMVVSVPKLYELVYAGAHELAAKTPVRQRIFDWGLDVGHRAARHRLAGRPVPTPLAAQLAVADRLVLRNVRDAVGGPKSVMACGGAPIRREVEDFFYAAGLHIQCGYGLTEAAPLISFNAPDDFELGTAGKVLQGGELRIADDGEICYRGANVMRGYWGDDEATAQVLDADGWLRTGDIGTLDERGFLRITDRLKDIIVTLQGKNIAPAPIESLITRDPLIENVVVLGDDRPCLVALVEPAAEPLAEWARANGLGEIATDPDRLNASPEVLAELGRRVEAACADLPSQEVVRDTRVLPGPLTMENGMLTPTLKVRRRAVERTFQPLVDQMYAEIAQRRAATRR